MHPSFRTLSAALGVALVASAPAFAWQSRAEAHALPAVASLPFVSWQSRVEGQPTTFYAGSNAGVYFWHDPAGLRLRTTDQAGNGHEYQGTITTDGTIFNLSPVQLESNDTYNLGPAGHVLTFDFHTANEIDGLNFDISGDATGLKLGVQWDDSSCGGSLCSMPVSNFYLGANSVTPENNPLWVCREDNGACLSNLP